MNQQASEPQPGEPRPGKPLRRDAERNRQRILTAAAELFAQDGLGVTLDQVAQRAGVGIGTVYRRFPDKQALVEELFRNQVTTLAQAAERAAAAADPGAAFTQFLTTAVGQLAGDNGLSQLLFFAGLGYCDASAGYIRARMQPVVTTLLHRAQEAGQVRNDLDPADIPFLMLMLATAASYAGQTRPAIWRRYLALVLDGMRPQRAGQTWPPLPEPALTPDQMERVMSAAAWRAR